MSALGRVRRNVEKHLPKLAAVYRHTRDLWASMRPSKLTPLGFRFIGPPGMQDGSFEATEVNLVHQLLRHADTLINVGANAGYYCCIAAAEGKSIIAFEPLPENVRLLLRNIAENQFSAQVEIFPVGLDSKVGIVNLFGGGTGASLVKGWAGASAEQVRLIPTTTADLVLGERLDGTRCLIIMDIEGAEYRALLGSSKLLTQNPRPIWMIEIVADENHPEGAAFNSDFENSFELFWSNGYEAWTASDSPRRVTRDDIETMTSKRTNTIGVHNYIFVDPKDRPDFLAGPQSQRQSE